MLRVRYTKCAMSWMCSVTWARAGHFVLYIVECIDKNVRRDVRRAMSWNDTCGAGGGGMSWDDTWGIYDVKWYVRWLWREMIREGAMTWDDTWGGYDVGWYMRGLWRKMIRKGLWREMIREGGYDVRWYVRRVWGDMIREGAMTWDDT